MSNPKLKVEVYNSLGGINSKNSQYQLTPLEFLDIINFDFQTPGAFTSRWGSTMYTGQTFPAKISAIFEYAKLNGFSQVITAHTGSIWIGATTGQAQGLSLTGLGNVTSYTGAIFFFGWPNLFPVPNPVAHGGDLNQVLFPGFTLVSNQNTQADNKLDFVTITDNLFAADGSQFFKYNGTTTTFYGLPFPVAYGMGYSLAPNFTGPISSTAIVMTNATLASFAYFASYVNNRGFESEIWPILYVDLTATNGTSIPTGMNYVTAAANFFIPPGYGITGINIYSYVSLTLFSSASASLIAANLQSITLWSPGYVLLKSVPVGNNSTLSIALGTTSGGANALLNNIGQAPDLNSISYYPLGATFIFGGATTSGTQQFDGQYINEISLNTGFIPKYLEVYQNRLFLAGFSAAPSTVYFSATGEPEGIPLDNNFEVRTNDNDYITCIQSYSSRLYIFKKNSFHILTGDNPNNFFLTDVSTIYGCVNNRSSAVFEDYMIFLDRKGVMIFDGSKIQCLSTKIQPLFDQMNYSAALSEAIMVHDKARNEILVSFPRFTSLTNNTTVVYDYIQGSWTRYSGYNPSVYAVVQGYNPTKSVFYGSYSGTVNWFGPSFFSDNGVGFTTSFKTRFLYDMGESVEKQFRRLYVNIDPGITRSMQVNFYQDYGVSIVYTPSLPITFNPGDFQERIDYGIPAKALAFEIFNLDANNPLRIDGFTIESRLQRNT